MNNENNFKSIFPNGVQLGSILTIKGEVRAASTIDNTIIIRPSKVIDIPDSYILCAAIHIRNNKQYVHQPKNIDSGLVVCGRRHHNCFAIISAIFPEHDALVKNIKDHVQGFITSDNRFVDRKEALVIATKAGQLEHREKYPPVSQLLSEDLYDCIAEDFKDGK